MSLIRPRGNSPDFDLDWFATSWRLRLDGPCPGLECSTGSNRVLSLGGLSARGRFGLWESERPVLSKFEVLGERVEASYSFPTWGGLSVRASWSLLRDFEGVDLEVQVLADSVDFLKGLEVQVVSQFSSRALDTPTMVQRVVVEARDRESAGLSYDGREPEKILQSLWTLPVPGEIGDQFRPKVIPVPNLVGHAHYVEFVHPEDVARRLTSEGQSPSGETGTISAVRYGIFGHDLEKGVLLRGRLRGLLQPAAPTRDQLDTLTRAFLETPLPLGP